MKRKPAVSRPLTRRVAAFLKEHGLINAAAPFVVGVSGGADSTCLLHVLVQLRTRLGLKLHAAHLNHELRGGESAEDAAFVARLCRGLDVPLDLQSANVLAYRRSRRLSMEEAAREYRYALFAQTAARLHAPVLLLGHTANDQVETVLLHMLRGAGLEGLKGMEATGRMPVPGHEGIALARPLLQTWRWETEDYCAEQGLVPRVDSSNLTPEFTRNRVRIELLPQLRRFNPRIEHALLRLAKHAGEAMDFIGAEAAEAQEGIVRLTPHGLEIDRRQLVALPSAVGSQVLRNAMQQSLGTPQGITSDHIRKMLGAATGPTGKTIRLPGRLVFSVDYDTVTLAPADRAAPVELSAGLGAIAVHVPGVADLPGWRVRADVLSLPELERLGERVDAPAGPFIACLDGALAGRALWVRSRQPGDRFQPLGMPAHKKLQDYLVDEKVPRNRRSQVLLVCDSDGILWVAGHRLDERARVRPGTDTVLRLEFQRKGTPASLAETRSSYPTSTSR